MWSKVCSSICRLWLTNFSCFLIVAGTILMYSCGSKQSTLNEYELYIDRAADVWRFQGSYLVAKRDSILTRRSRGFANISDQRINTPDTKFLIGSMTKSFTAIAIMQLVEKGLISLNKPLSAYISNYPKEVADKITIHDLLCHRSGIPDLLSNPDFIKRTRELISPNELINYFRDQPLNFTPGSNYSYSSSNYVLLGRIVAAVTRQPWEDYIQKHICAPLGMMNTGVYFDYTERSDFASGYALDPSGSLTGVPPVHPSCGYAAGALSSTVDDLYLLHRALYDNTLLNSRSVATMLAHHSPTYGYGWLVDDFGGHRLVAHGGGAPGYVSIIQRWVDDSVFVAVLCNNVTVPAHTIANALAAIALDEQYEMPTTKTPRFIPNIRLDEYEGSYKISSGEFRKVPKKNGQLSVQRSSGPAYPVFPDSIDRFCFGHDHMTSISFLRNNSNKIIAHILTQAFDQDTAWLAE